MGVHGPCYSIPFSRNERFVGRGTQLRTLEEKLLIDGHCQKIAIVGLGGVGKTQIALQFAYWVKEHYPSRSIFWVPAISIESFEQAFLRIAKELQIPGLEDERVDLKQIVKDFLSQESAGQWLLILDNADDVEILFRSYSKQMTALTEYLPESAKGLIVFTTRYQEVATSLAGSEVVEVDEMEEKVAVAMLKQSLIRKDLLSDERVTSELLKELTFLPLAITQAAAYINRNKNVSISRYLELLRKTEDDTISLLSRNFEDCARYPESKNPVATTWLISFDQIRRHDPDAADYLSFMSCIEPRMIPRSILPDIEPEEKMDHAIGTLCAYAFVVQRNDGRSYDLHRLVHLATRNWLQKQGVTQEWTKRVIQHLAEVFPSAEHTNRAIWNEYLPHVQNILDYGAGGEFEARYELCERTGLCLYTDGRYNDAEKWLSKTYEWRKTFGESQTKTLESAIGLSAAYLANWKVKKAVELLEHVVKIEKTTLVEDHPSRLASQHELARAYIANQQVKEAIELLEHVVKIKETTLAEDHPSRRVSEHAGPSL